MTLPRAADGIDTAPVWTILVALYREAECVPALLANLARLEWPPDRLDLIFACEADDKPTIQALMAHLESDGMHDRFRLVLVPEGGPRTKPNALQTALPFARGRFLSVYDAEDRPDPTQLRAAFAAFANGPASRAVVQAPLVAWNDHESWITRQFALDYAIWFRVVLPALARLTGLLPLGGTSNHFRTQILRDSGGWDPFNVTEDADLGVRLGRMGYRTALIDPPTFEEAPPRIGAWVKQRGRWIQGHIQTLGVHLRSPIALAQQLRTRGLLAFAFGLGTGPLAAALTLPCTLACMTALFLPMGQTEAISPIALGLLGISGLSHALSAVIASKRDGRRSLLLALPTLPLYHALQSLAALRAFYRILFTPAVWDKTDHGAAARGHRGLAFRKNMKA